MKSKKWTPRIEALEDRDMMNAAPLSVLVPEPTAGMLLPAVQKVREAAHSDTSHKETIEIESWSLGASNPSAITVLRWEKISVPMTGEDASAGSHALYQDITIPSVEEGGLSAGKVSYSDLSLAPAAEPVTLKVTMKDVMVSSAHDAGEAGPRHKETIEIESFSWGESTALTVNLSDVLISSLRGIDAEESPIKEAVLTARKSGGEYVVLPFAASFEVVGGVAEAAVKAGWDVSANKKI